LLGCEQEPTPVVFEVANVGTTQLFLDGHSPPVTLGDSWLLQDACEYCVCGEPCHGVCGQALPRVLTLEPGASTRFSWDGAIRMLRETTDRGSCQFRTPLSPASVTGSVAYSSPTAPMKKKVFSFDHPPPSGTMKIEIE
jgi:hypothetical protein